MDGKHQTNFYKMFVYVLEFLAIYSEFFQIFPARKTIYLNISGIYSLFWALSRPVENFQYFLGFFWYFSEFSSI